jgi:hypothetical protein
VTSLVRSACLTNFADVAARCSLGALALLKEVGLPPRTLEDPDLKVPALAVGQLLVFAAARGGDPAFGLRMAESRRLSNLGYLGKCSHLPRSSHSRRVDLRMNEAHKTDAKHKSARPAVSGKGVQNEHIAHPVSRMQGCRNQTAERSVHPASSLARLCECQLLANANMCGHQWNSGR